MKDIKLNFIDLFSGAGGISCGLEMTKKFKCLLGVDSNKDAINTFKLNHSYAETFCGDIRKLKGKLLKEKLKNQKIDLVVGGPPCQGFSTVGIGNPDDSRNILFLEFCRIVKETKPTYIIMENVTGLVASKNQKTLTAIIKYFSKLGYTLDVKVLEAYDYGVPEKRRRTIFIGSNKHKKIIFPSKTNKFKTVKDAFLNLKHTELELKECEIKSEIDLKRLQKIPEGCGIRYERDEKKYLSPSLYLGVNWNKIPERRFRQTKFQRLNMNLPSPTIMTSRHMYYHPTEDRFISLKEAARIQTFPDSFIFTGSTTSKWRQVGNAVPPLLAFAIGKAILEMNNGKIIKSKKNKKIEISEIRKKAFAYKKSNI